MADLDPEARRQIKALLDYADGLLKSGLPPPQVVGMLMAKGLDQQLAREFVQVVLSPPSNPPGPAGSMGPPPASLRPPPQPERVYPLRPYRPSMIWKFACTIGVSVFFGYLAYTNDRGLRIMGLLTLSRGMATAAYAGLALLPGAWTLFAGAQSVLTIVHRHKIVLTDSFICVPRWWTSAELFTIPFVLIQGLEMGSDQGPGRTAYADIKTPLGDYRVEAALLSSAGFRDIVSTISAYLQGTGATSSQ